MQVGWERRVGRASTITQIKSNQHHLLFSCMGNSQVLQGQKMAKSRYNLTDGANMLWLSCIRRNVGTNPIK